MSIQPEFPFTAVIGQSRFKLALKLAAIDPRIGGLLVSGPRGTAKSTLARGLPEIVPDPVAFVNLPLGASEEMLTGTLDLQRALGEKQVAFSPGLFARAHGGVLYVDEINLLPDNLVDLLLDVASGGINHVERDGISHRHEARFILLGTMNPEEGELRTQLQDRFGMSVRIQERFNVQERVEIARQRELFERDPVTYCRRRQSEQDALRDVLQQAIRLRENVDCPEDMRMEIAERCLAADVDGLRADIVWIRAALAHAALGGVTRVRLDDVDAVEGLVLDHRRRDRKSCPSDAPPESPASSPSERHGRQGREDGDWGQMPPLGQPTAAVSKYRAAVSASGADSVDRRNGSAFSRRQGRRGYGSRLSGYMGSRLDWFRTLAANPGQWPLSRLRFRRRRCGDPVLHLILLDTSASTLRNSRLADAKAAILDIAEQAYLDRAQLAILGFGNQQVRMLLSNRRTPRGLRCLLDRIEGGGGTPLRSVIERAAQYQEVMHRTQPELRFCTYLITDGRSSASLSGLALRGDTVLIDMETSRIRRGRATEIAETLGAAYHPLPA